jgi:hypothetical protein
MGNISPAAITLANKQHHASLITVTAVGGRVGGGSGMGYSVAMPRPASFGGSIARFCRGPYLRERQFLAMTARSSQKSASQTVAKNRPDHLSCVHSAMQVTLDHRNVA